MKQKYIPVPEQFQASFDELMELDNQIYDLKAQHKQKSMVLWTAVEQHLDLRGAALRYEKEHNRIVVIDQQKEADAAMRERIRQGGAVPHAAHPAAVDVAAMGSALPRIHMRKQSGWQKVKRYLTPWKQ